MILYFYIFFILTFTYKSIYIIYFVIFLLHINTFYITKKVVAEGTKLFFNITYINTFYFYYG